MAEDKRPGEEGKKLIIQCPVCKCQGPFLMNQQLGALICKSCGVFFMNEATRKELYKQMESKLILPSQVNRLAVD